MGGQSKSQTIGYNYFIGEILVLGQGPIDYISEISMRDDRKVVWSGQQYGNGTFDINKPNLFGGNTSQGGVSGKIHYMDGNPSQTQHPYLVKLFGQYVPSYREVVILIFEKLCIGMNPYPPITRVRGSRIHNQGISADGNTILRQWYDEKAGIPVATSLSIDEMMTAQYWDYKWYAEPVELSLGNANKAIDIDLTGWTVDQDKIDVPFESAVGSATFPCETSYFGELVNTVMWYRWNFTPKNNQKIVLDASSLFQCDIWLNGNKLEGFASGSKTITLESNQIIMNGNNVLAIRASGGQHGEPEYYLYRLEATPYPADFPPYSVDPMVAVSFYLDLFNNAEPPPAYPYVFLSMTGSNPYDGFNFNGNGGLGADSHYDLQSFLVSTVPATPNVITFEAATILIYGMNPIHIIRESFTRPFGCNLPEALFPDSNWQAAADVIYDEGLGMTANWTNQVKIKDFQQNIQRHINAEVYKDRLDGFWKVKLLRKDYDPDSLIHLNKSNSTLIDSKKPKFGSLPTSVTVNFTDIANDWTVGTAPQYNSALARMQGNEIPINRDYKGFIDFKTASNKALQDLQMESAALEQVTIKTNLIAKNLNKGHVFKLTWGAPLDLTDAVMRVTEIDFGDTVSNEITITCIRDVFDAITDLSTIKPVTPGGGSSYTVPTALKYRLVQEAPYLELVQAAGQATVDAQLLETPESGYVISAVGRETNANKALMYDGVAGSYSSVGTVDFCPFAILDEDIVLGGDDVTFAITDGTDLDQTAIGKWFQIDNEIFCITALSDSSVTAKHGCLDTIPASHLTGAKIYFWDDYALIDSTEFVVGNNVSTKLLSVNPIGQLSLDDAPVDSTVILGRAARPYNVANIKLNDVYYNDSISGDLIITWANRNRISQTSSTVYGFTDGNITPESGVTVTFNLIDSATNTILLTHDAIVGITDTFTSSELGALNADLILEVYTVRDGLDSYQKYQIPFINYNSGEFITFEDGDLLEIETLEKVRIE